MKLGDYLERTDMTLQAFGDRLGVSHTTVLRWAKGQAIPRGRARLEALRVATDGAVTAADFFPGAKTGMAETQAPFAAEAPFLEAPFLEAPFLEARALGLDAAAIATRAVQQAISAEKARRWLEENREAIAAHNRWVEEHGLPLAEYRMF